MPPEPVVDSGSVRAFSVPHRVRSPAQTSSISAMNSGSRWPSSGRVSAVVASG